MKLIKTHFLIHWLQFVRQPSYLVSSFVFPSLFFCFFALPNVDNPTTAKILLGSFSAFAVLGVAFFQFTVEIAQERASGWSHYTQTLPLPLWPKLLGRLLCALIMSLSCAWVLMITVHWTTDLELDLMWLSKTNIVLIFGSLPFGFLAMSIGHWVGAQSALPIANLFYLPLSFAGGLWMPPQNLSQSLQQISEWLPTRHYAELLWALALEKPLPKKSILIMVAYLAAFIFLYLLASRKSRAVKTSR